MSILSQPIGRLRYLGYNILLVLVVGILYLGYVIQIGLDLTGIYPGILFLLFAFLYGICSVIISYKRIRDITLHQSAPLVLLIPFLASIVKGIIPVMGFEGSAEMNILQTVLSVASFILVIVLLVVAGKKPQIVESLIASSDQVATAHAAPQTLDHH